MEDRMNFYYNIQMGVCAEENWVVDFLVENEDCEDREEALEGLRTCRDSMVGLIAGFQHNRRTYQVCIMGCGNIPFCPGRK